MLPSPLYNFEEMKHKGKAEEAICLQAILHDFQDTENFVESVTASSPVSLAQSATTAASDAMSCVDVPSSCLPNPTVDHFVPRGGHNEENGAQG